MRCPDRRPRRSDEPSHQGAQQGDEAAETVECRLGLITTDRQKDVAPGRLPKQRHTPGLTVTKCTGSPGREGGGVVTADEFSMLRAIASRERIEPYLVICLGDRSAAVRLYSWNIQVSAAFQAPLGCLEVAFRNALHYRLSTLFGRGDWWLSPGTRLHHTGQHILTEAVQEIQRRGIRPTPGRVVAELPFGFWVSLLGSGTDYETRLWRPALRHAFPGYRGQRRPLHQEFDEVRRFRNRIAHHEPIHRRDLVADHVRVIRLLGYVSPEYAAWVRLNDRVPDVLAHKADVCQGLLSTGF